MWLIGQQLKGSEMQCIFYSTFYSRVTAICSLGLHKSILPVRTQYFVGGPLAVIATLESSLECLVCRWIEVFRSHHRFSLEFKSGLWLGHSWVKTLFLSHSCVLFAMRFGFLLCWDINFHPKRRLLATRNRSFLRICLCLVPSFLLFIRTSFSVPPAEKHPHSMILPPPWLMIRVVLPAWWAVFGLLSG